MGYAADTGKEDCRGGFGGPGIPPHFAAADLALQGKVHYPEVHYPDEDTFSCNGAAILPLQPHTEHSLGGSKAPLSVMKWQCVLL